MSAQLAYRRLILSGDVVELYDYQFPFIWGNQKVSSASVSKGSKKRVDNLFRVRQEIRRLVECNYASYGFEPVFLTFTFAENMTDVKKANRLFSLFIQRFNYVLGSKLKYLTVIEFQKRGAIHYHAIFFNLSLEWEKKERSSRAIAKLWGHGFIDIERVRSAKRVAPYVCKYLDKSINDARLFGQKSYFTSKGLIKPIEYRKKDSIDNILSEYKMNEVLLESSYLSDRFGKVNYIQYV